MTSNTIILITGANTGLGLELVRSLCKSEKAYEILLGGRSAAKARSATDAVTKEHPTTRSKLWPVQIDIEDDDSIQRLFDEVEARFGKLDVLVNNAGAQHDQKHHAGEITMRQLWTMDWSVNAVGAQLMTAKFIPLLLRSSDPRLLFMTSGTSTLKGTEDLELPFNKVPHQGWPKSTPTAINNIAAYRSSKCGMNMMMREWHRMLVADGVKVWCISPGYLATGLGGDPEKSKKLGAGDPSLAGSFMKAVVEGQRDSDAGKVLLRDGVQPW